jgi:hypothetical protein
MKVFLLGVDWEGNIPVVCSTLAKALEVSAEYSHIDQILEVEIDRDLSQGQLYEETVVWRRA